jgi:CRP-like cAMP-binding protein
MILTEKIQLAMRPSLSQRMRLALDFSEELHERAVEKHLKPVKKELSKYLSNGREDE